MYSTSSTFSNNFSFHKTFLETVRRFSTEQFIKVGTNRSTLNYFETFDYFFVLPNQLRLRILENEEILGKPQY